MNGTEEDDAGQMQTRQQFEEQITVRRIQCPHVDDDFEIHQDALSAAGERSALRTTWPGSRLNIARASDRQ